MGLRPFLDRFPLIKRKIWCIPESMLHGITTDTEKPTTKRAREFRERAAQKGRKVYAALWPEDMIRELDAAAAATGARGRDAMMEKIWKDNPDLFRQYFKDLFPGYKGKAPKDGNP